jgi:hypothetical protein
LWRIPEGTLEQIVVETDAQELVSLWKNRSKQRSEIAAILNEIEELASAFTSFVIQHVRREANYVAHCCAHFALGGSRQNIYIFFFIFAPNFFPAALI